MINEDTRSTGLDYSSSARGAVFCPFVMPDSCHNEMKIVVIDRHRSARMSTLMWHGAKSSLLRGHFFELPKLNTGVRFPSSALSEVPARWPF